MLQIRKSEARGHFDHGWLNTYHTFSFADYHDPAHMGFRTLRVINEDRVQPGEGFGTHSHQDMEIISYVLEGVVEHKDSLGNMAAIRPGDVQRMSAGTGVTHSEYNPSKKERVHFLQIWILPEKKGLKPGYEQKAFSPEEKQNKLCLVASREGKNGSVIIHQDVNLYASLLDSGRSLSYSIPPGRHVWCQLLQGEVQAGKFVLHEGDGVSASDERNLKIEAKAESEFLLFDLS